MGVWGKTWNRAVVFRGRGGSGFSPSAFPECSPLLPVYSRSRAVVFPTSPLLLVGGVTSGTWRRRGASASAQAGGGTETETRRTAPARAGAALYGRCAGCGWGLCACCQARREPGTGTERFRAGPGREVNDISQGAVFMAWVSPGKCYPGSRTGNGHLVWRSGKGDPGRGEFPGFSRVRLLVRCGGIRRSGFS